MNTIIDIGTYILVLYAISFLEALWNVALFRHHWSWFPFWGKSKEFDNIPEKIASVYASELNHTIFDPFHIIKGIFVITLVTGFMENIIPVIWIIRYWMPNSIEWVLIALYIGAIWLLYYGIFFRFNYHWLLMKPQYRDWRLIA